MSIRNLAEVRVRLEKAVAGLPEQATTPAEIFDQYEMVAQLILDSEFCDHPDGALSEYLLTLLYAKQLELGLHPDYPESE